MRTDEKELKQVGLKITQPRLKILDILTHSDTSHLSAEDIYQQLKSYSKFEIGLATVYRVLGQFEKAGLVIRHRFDENHSVYELDRGRHHDHLVCVKCGAVQEFVDESIENRQKEIVKKYGAELVDHSLYLYIICKDCINLNK